MQASHFRNHAVCATLPGRARTRVRHRARPALLDGTVSGWAATSAYCAQLACSLVLVHRNAHLASYRGRYGLFLRPCHPLSSNATSPLVVAQVVAGLLWFRRCLIKAANSVNSVVSKRWIFPKHARCVHGFANCEAVLFDGGRSEGLMNRGIDNCRTLWCVSMAANGTYSNFDSYCYQCPYGSVSGMGSSQCTVCPAGRFTNTYPASQCTSCGAGTYSTGGPVACQSCPVGFWSSVEAGQCEPCPAGT